MGHRGLGNPGEEAPAGHPDELTLSALAAGLDMDAPVALRVWTSRGLQAGTPEETLDAIAAGNGTTPNAIHPLLKDSLTPQALAALATAVHKPAGPGRMSLAQVSEAGHLPLQSILARSMRQAWPRRSKPCSATWQPNRCWSPTNCGTSSHAPPGRSACR